MNKQSGAGRAYMLLTGSEPVLEKEPEFHGIKAFWFIVISLSIFVVTMFLTFMPTKAKADEHNKITVVFRPNCFPVIGYTCSQLADAIYKVENSKKYPYGIMKQYKNTSPRQACLNTINSRLKKWLKTDQETDFIDYLGQTYSENPSWSAMVRSVLKRGDK